MDSAEHRVGPPCLVRMRRSLSHLGLGFRVGCSCFVFRAYSFDG